MPSQIPGEGNYNFIDLFAGAGGLSEGFIQAGFNPIAHVEMNQFAAQTLVTRSAYYYLKQTNQLNTYYRYLRGEIKHDELYREEVQEGLREQAGAYCPYCGKQNHNEDANFCMYCGMRFRV